MVNISVQHTQDESNYPLFTEKQVRGRSRQIDTSGSVWRIGENDNQSLNFDLIELANPSLLDHLKYCLAEWLKSWAPDTVFNHFKAVKMFLNSCSEISEDSVGNELQTELEDEIVRYFIINRNDEHQLSLIRAWYKKSEELELPAFDEYVALHLAGLRLKGNTKGLDVVIQIDGRGPLRTDELFHLKDLLKKHQSTFEAGTALYRKFIATWLFMVLGIRPQQLRLLQGGDLRVKANSGNKKLYILNVPSVKKHYSLPRTFFKQRQLPTFLGEMVEIMIGNNQLKAKRKGFQDGPLPLFMSSSAVRVETGLSGALLYMFNADYLSQWPNEILAELNRLECLKPVEERRPLEINLNPRRLRKTFATQAAAQGLPVRVLAELLDHEDLQHVMVYYEQTVEFTHKLDAVYQESFGDIFNFFKGTIAVEELLAAHKNQVIYGPDNLRKLVEIGYCGSDQRCTLAPPYSCYGCNKLQACNSKAVHEEVLKSMMEEVEQLFHGKVSPGKYDAEHILACKQLIIQLEDHG